MTAPPLLAQTTTTTKNSLITLHHHHRRRCSQRTTTSTTTRCSALTTLPMLLLLPPPPPETYRDTPRRRRRDRCRSFTDSSRKRAASRPNASHPTSHRRQPLPPFVLSFCSQPKDDIQVFWSRLSLLLYVLQTLVLMGLEIAVLAFDGMVYFKSKAEDLDEVSLKAGRTYHSAFLASLVFGLFVAWDAILHQNFVQTLAVLAFCVGCLVFAVIQILQSRSTLGTLTETNHGAPDPSTDYVIQYVLFGVTAAWIPAFAYLCYRMFGEFGWTIYRATGGDKKMERAFRNYHIHNITNKFSIFFVLLFVIINLVLVETSQLSEVMVPVLVIPAILGVGVLGWLGARRESAALTACFLLGNLCLLAYLGVHLLTRVFPVFGDDAFRAEMSRRYGYLRRPLAFWGALASALVVASCVCAVVCWRQFGAGLKAVLDAQRLWGGGRRAGGPLGVGAGGNGAAEDVKAGYIDLDD
ncbi:hypothetical protein DFJ73DRAFT_849184 [Zopfochytrium polystomum]|nr:hypothetical protein DFJ73DRAFT_849184 [Zopfochytrium polystomum]